jgi:hypothetical protein
MVNLSRDAPKVEMFVHQFLEILKREQLRQDTGYELRLLRIPGMLVDAFWLHSRTGQPDFAFPILAPAAVERRLYQMEDFVKTLQPLAGKYLGFNRGGGMRPQSRKK